MRCRARRVAHVVQAVEKGDEIEILFRIILGRPDLEAGIRRDIALSGVRSRVLDRARVEVVTDKLRVRKRLRHDYGGQALTAPDIATRPPRSSFSTTPSSAGSQLLTKL